MKPTCLDGLWNVVQRDDEIGNCKYCQCLLMHLVERFSRVALQRPLPPFAMVKRKRENRPTTTFTVPSSAVFASTHTASVQRVHPNRRHHIHHNDVAFTVEPPPKVDTPSPLPTIFSSPLAANDDFQADPDPFDEDPTPSATRREYATLVSHHSAMFSFSHSRHE